MLLWSGAVQCCSCTCGNGPHCTFDRLHPACSAHLLAAWRALLSAACTLQRTPLGRMAQYHDAQPSVCCAVQVSGTIITAAGAEVDRLVSTGRRAVEMAGRQQFTPQVGGLGMVWITCRLTHDYMSHVLAGARCWREPGAFVTVGQACSYLGRQGRPFKEAVCLAAPQLGSQV